MNEWGFAGEVKSWWDQELAEHPEWGLSRCEIERQDEGSRERADVSIVADDNTVILVLELRLPDHSLPSPWDLANLSNAAGKAARAGARWAATSDADLFLLLDTTKSGPLFGRVVHRPKLAKAATRANLDVPATLAQIREAWILLLHSLVPVLRGAPPALIPPDELFIESLRALLAAPVAAIRDEVSDRKDTDAAFCDALIRWMVDQQGWPHSLDQFDEEIKRVASVSAYVFTTRLLFYEALRRAQPDLRPITLGTDSDPRIASLVIKNLFDEAQQISGDYETVFAFDKVCEYALLNSNAVQGWHRVLDHLGQFELDAVGYDVLGRLFERFIEPAERYKWGQHYTSPDVVDLMLSLAIPDGSGTILDPASGGGTFLVRGYVRKQVLQPGQTHQARLAELAGCDISAFAASLATVSLAARDLSFADNYPRVKASSFFQRVAGGEFIALPKDGTSRPVVLDPATAVVCNPPYIALRHLGNDRKNEAAHRLRLDAQDGTVPKKLVGAANYHLYFWFHAAQFITRDGRLVFITSGEWLDSDYGALLQQWLLNNTKVELVVESVAEAWFTEARVGTVVLCARRCADEQERAANKVNFVTLRQPLPDLYGCSNGETDEEHIAHVDALRDELLGLDSALSETDRFDHSTIAQPDLYALGER